MKTLSALTLVTLLALIVNVSALEQCPANCEEEMCSDLGCVRCVSGFYLFFDQDTSKSVCLQSCPNGYYSNPANWCQKCATINCVKCEDEYTCTECEAGYHVNSDGDCIFTDYVLN